MIQARRRILKCAASALESWEIFSDARSQMSSRAGRLLLLTILVATSIPMAASAAPTDFSGLVDIGSGRKMFLDCRGEGTPTIVLISGKGNGAAAWSEVLDPADPIRTAPFDAVGAGQGQLLESEDAVLPAISRITRVCAYDRPGTRIDGADISTPVAQPHRVDQAVDDLRTLLAAAGEPGPYVLVPHSYGGLVALLYARTHPDDVAGLVMVDAATERMRQAFSVEALAAWDASHRVSHPAAPEAVELLDAIARIEAAPSLPGRLAIVLSADKPWQLAAPDKGDRVGGEKVTFSGWLAAQDLLAASLQARHITVTASGHYIQVEQPQLVINSILEVVEAARSGKIRLLP